MSPASSDAAASPEVARRTAEEHFRNGLALAKVPGNWEAALGEFLESRRLFPTRSATRNAAIASRALGRYGDALGLYDALLADFATELGDDERRTYEAERSALLQHFGRIAVQVSEPGAIVTVDGRPRGTTPVKEPLLVEAGNHVVHAAKDGFQGQDREVFVSAGATRSLELEMRPVSGARFLIVTEATGEPLEVVVDAASVGRAPWRGAVSAGIHSVLLRGAGRGTAPVTVDLRSQPSVSVELRAVVLDAEARIEPTPASATLYIDSELAGSGAWAGSLPSGAHRFDVIAPDHLPFQQRLTLAAGSKVVLRPRLAPNRPVAPPFTGLYVEPSAGLLFGRTLRGSVDDACDCDSRSRPFGWLASVRFGYELTRHFAPELSAGFMRVTERSTRTVYAGSAPGRYGFVSHDERDSIQASGPFLQVSGAARFFERVPVTARISAGAALFGLSFANSGTFSGYVENPVTGVGEPASGGLSIEEPSQRAIVPFVGTELRAGYSFTPRVSVDFGASLSVFMPPRIMRAQRAGLLTGPDHDRADVLTLPDEVAFRTFLLLAPSIGVRVEL